LLKRELEIRKAELMEKILFSSLEKIFIENRIYRAIEECETFEAVISTIDKGLKPYKNNSIAKSPGMTSSGLPRSGSNESRNTIPLRPMICCAILRKN